MYLFDVIGVFWSFAPLFINLNLYFWDKFKYERVDQYKFELEDKFEV